MDGNDEGLLFLVVGSGSSGSGSDDDDNGCGGCE